MRNRKLKTALLSTVALLAVAVAAASIGPGFAGQNNDDKADKADKADKNAAVDPNSLPTKYPIKHLVVIFNENVSFRSLFRYLSQCLEHGWRTSFRACQGYAAGRQQSFDEPGAAQRQSQPECGQRHGR